MITIDDKKKVVVITNETPVSNATFKFSEIDRLKTISPDLFDRISKQLEVHILSNETPSQKQEINVSEIRRRVTEGLSKIETLYIVTINSNDKGKPEGRYKFPGFTSIAIITPENLYMSSWDDWSSGERWSWNLTEDPNKLINYVKSCASDTSEITIRKLDTEEVIFYHRGEKY